MQSRPATRPMPVTMPADGHSSSYMPFAASAPTSRKGLPRSSSRSMRSRTSSLRATAKADRRQRYLDAAAELFAARGYAGVSIEELGAAAGVSGPALYRHFRGKEDVLAELLVSASERLLDGATAAIAAGTDPAATLADLVAFHADFALAERDVIRVQDRELASLGEAASRRVRSLQRRYVEAWADVLVAVRPEVTRAEAV